MNDASKQTKTILVVEDEIGLRAMIVEELSDAGFDILEAEIGDEAIAIIDSGRVIDVLFTDIRLPGGLDGWEIAKHARNSMPNIHVVYASGYGGDRAAQVPNSLYVKKPYLPRAVVGEIKQRLSGGHAGS